MHFLDHIIDSLKEIAKSHTDDGGFILSAKVFLAKLTLKGISPVFGFVSAIFMTVSNLQFNEALRTLYLIIAILFICMSLLWASWKNKEATNEMVTSIKKLLKSNKNDKPPSGNGGTDPAHEILHQK